MIRACILKYKNEFDHWVLGGKLLRARARDKIKVWENPEDKSDFFNTNDEYYIYIINDSLVEFRKAFIDLKVVQILTEDRSNIATDLSCCNKPINYCRVEMVYQDVISIDEISEENPIENYRIL